MNSNAADALRHFKPARHPRGLTLVEVMVTLAIFSILSGFMFMAVQQIVNMWSRGDRERVLYEKANGVVDLMADDIRLALTEEPASSTEVKIRFIGDLAPGTQQQRLMFVRSFETGPERALVLHAGDGRMNQPLFTPQPSSDNKGSVKPAAASYTPDSDDYTGTKMGDFRALGGMAMVAYFVENQTLYRAIHAPVEGSMSALLNAGAAQTVAPDVLYLAFDYWGQATQAWEEPALNSKVIAADRIWDSTRGIRVSPLNRFRLHRGPESLNDPEDDVFPRKVRITVTIDSNMPRCLYTKLTDDVNESDGKIPVESTRGFPEGGGPDSFILIDNEWVEYSKREEYAFVAKRRGARRTAATGHREKAIIRIGKTFRRIVYIPNYRDDFTPDDVYYARKQVQSALSRKKVNP